MISCAFTPFDAAQRQETSPTVVRAAEAQRAGMLRWTAVRPRLLTSRRNLVNGVGRYGGDGGPRPGVIGRDRWPTESAPGAMASILRSHGRRWREGLYGFSIDRSGLGHRLFACGGRSHGPLLRIARGTILTPPIGAGQRSCAVLSQRGPLVRGAPTLTCRQLGPFSPAGPLGGYTPGPTGWVKAHANPGGVFRLR
jgi:hypothetical protein